MEIRTVQRTTPGSVEIQAVLAEAEYLQLAGHLQDLYVFARPLVNNPTSLILTGARHSHAKYLLFPKNLRRRCRMNHFDPTELSCGLLSAAGRLYVIYNLPGKTIPTALGHDDTETSADESRDDYGAR